MTPGRTEAGYLRQLELIELYQDALMTMKGEEPWPPHVAPKVQAILEKFQLHAELCFVEAADVITVEKRNK